MKAVYYDEVGEAVDTLRLGDLPVAQPAPGEVRVRIHASGINPSDIKRRSGWLNQGAEPARVVPHNDGAGVIDAIGPGISDDRIGQPVWIYEATRHGRKWGTAAEYVVIPEQLAVPLPTGPDFIHAASLGVPAMTAHNAVFADGAVDGLTVLVAGGAGAVGRCAVQLALWGGASVVATAGSPKQIERAYAAGAHAVVNYRDTTAAAELRELAPQGYDKIIEVALDKNARMDVELAKAGSTIICYASGDNPDGSISIPGRAMLSKRICLRWVHIYSTPYAQKRAAISDITKALSTGALSRPPVLTLPVEEIVKAHDIVGTHGGGERVIVTF